MCCEQALVLVLDLFIQCFHDARAIRALLSVKIYLFKKTRKITDLL